MKRFVARFTSSTMMCRQSQTLRATCGRVHFAAIQSKPLSIPAHLSRRWSCTQEAYAHHSYEDDEEIDYNDSFRVFDLPYRFEIDEAALKECYRDLMAQYHPDRNWHGRSESEISASEVTRAYDQLRRKHTRAMHLMELLGHPVDETSSGNVVGMEFLMEIMELREQVDQMASGDASLKRMWKENQTRIDETCRELDAAIQKKDYDKGIELTARLQYWNRMDETIREKLDNLDHM